jgi:hypothetical protein
MTEETTARVRYAQANFEREEIFRELFPNVCEDRDKGAESVIIGEPCQACQASSTERGVQIALIAFCETLSPESMKAKARAIANDFGSGR